MGGGGLTSTLSDYLAFLHDILSENPKVLKKDTVEEFVKTNHLNEGLQCSVLPYAYPYSDERSFIPGPKTTHSMACALTEEGAPGMRPKGTLTWAGLLNSYYLADPINNVCGGFGLAYSLIAIGQI